MKTCTVCQRGEREVTFAKNGKYFRTYCTACQNKKRNAWKQERKEASGSTSLVCPTCAKPFERSLTLHIRNQERELTGFCGPACTPKRARQGDELSPFRRIISHLASRSDRRAIEFSLDAQYLQELWLSQSGTCPLTGWLLDLLEVSSIAREASPNRASVDRIDQSKGYVRGNVRFIALMANYARSIWSDGAVVAFCQAVTSKHGNAHDNGLPCSHPMDAPTPIL